MKYYETKGLSMTKLYLGALVFKLDNKETHIIEIKKKDLDPETQSAIDYQIEVGQFKEIQKPAPKLIHAEVTNTQGTSQEEEILPKEPIEKPKAPASSDDKSKKKDNTSK